MKPKYSAALSVAIVGSFLTVPFPNEAQTKLASCPTGKPLKLDQVVGQVNNKVADDRIEELVSVCHVDFSLDPAALERLSTAGASAPLVDALSADTISRMTSAQAHTEVVALEKAIKENASASNTERDAALAKLDADYQASPARSPKDQFETTAAYQARIAAAEQKHASDRAQVQAKYADDLALAKNQAAARRIAALKNGLYPVAGPAPAFVNYDADKSRMTAAIGGQEFYFTVSPDRAKVLHDHWNAVKALQHYDDDASHSRFITEAANIDPVSGISRTAIDQQEKERMEAEAAARKAQEEKLAAQQAAAAAAQAAADAAREQQLALRKKLDDTKALFRQNPKMIPGTWGDAVTGFLWTEKDNGKNIDWQDAKNYCQQVLIGGSSDWRLATISELTGLYDPKNNTLKGDLVDKAARLGFNLTPNSRPPQPKYYHIKGGIHLSEMISWSSTTIQNGVAAMIKRFDTGMNSPAAVGAKDGRVLCVGNVQ